MGPKRPPQVDHTRTGHVCTTSAPKRRDGTARVASLCCATVDENFSTRTRICTHHDVKNWYANTHHDPVKNSYANTHHDPGKMRCHHAHRLSAAIPSFLARRPQRLPLEPSFQCHVVLPPMGTPSRPLSAGMSSEGVTANLTRRMIEVVCGHQQKEVSLVLPSLGLCGVFSIGVDDCR